MYAVQPVARRIWTVDLRSPTRLARSPTTHQDWSDQLLRYIHAVCAILHAGYRGQFHAAQQRQHAGAQCAQCRDLVDALSFTEAEARITDKMQPFISGDFKVDAVKRVNLSDIFYNEGGDRWYKVKTNFITIDEKTAVEKRTASYQLVQASDLKQPSKLLRN